MPDFSFHRRPRPPSGCSNGAALNRDCLSLSLPQGVQGSVAWQRPTAGAESEDSFWPMSRSWSSQGSPSGFISSERNKGSGYKLCSWKSFVLKGAPSKCRRPQRMAGGQVGEQAEPLQVELLREWVPHSGVTVDS